MIVDLGMESRQVRSRCIARLQRRFEDAASSFPGTALLLRFHRPGESPERGVEVTASPFEQHVSLGTGLMRPGRVAWEARVRKAVDDGSLSWEPGGGGCAASGAVPDPPAFERPIITAYLTSAGGDDRRLVDGAAALAELSQAAWPLLEGLGDAGWAALRCAGDREVPSGGIANEVWIGDAWLTEAEVAGRRWYPAPPTRADRLVSVQSGLGTQIGWPPLLHTFAWAELPGTTVRAKRSTWTGPGGRLGISRGFDGMVAQLRRMSESALAALPLPLRWFESSLPVNPFDASAEALEFLDSVVCDMAPGGPEHDGDMMDASGPRTWELVDAAAIDATTFLRYRKAADVGPDWSSAESRRHRYSRPEVRQLIRAVQSLAGKRAAKIAEAWRKWA